jgi:hypothetical protein
VGEDVERRSKAAALDLRFFLMREEGAAVAWKDMVSGVELSVVVGVLGPTVARKALAVVPTLTDGCEELSRVVRSR